MTRRSREAPIMNRDTIQPWHGVLAAYQIFTRQSRFTQGHTHAEIHTHTHKNQRCYCRSRRSRNSPTESGQCRGPALISLYMEQSVANRKNVTVSHIYVVIHRVYRALYVTLLTHTRTDVITKIGSRTVYLNTHGISNSFYWICRYILSDISCNVLHVLASYE